MLPYFKANFNREYVYIFAGSEIFLERTIGSAIHYKFKYPTNKKFAISLTVYILLSFIDASLLFLPTILIFVSSFIEGLMGVISFNIRIFATQSYVHDNKKGRFNGIFQKHTITGMLLRQFISGILSQYYG